MLRRALIFEIATLLAMASIVACTSGETTPPGPKPPGPIDEAGPGIVEAGPDVGPDTAAPDDAGADVADGGADVEDAATD